METRERTKSNVTPRLKLVGSPVLERANSANVEPFVSSESSGNVRNSVDGVDDALLSELPAFERHEESTAIELFYDLFFVANLTTFSNIHEINSIKTLTSYVGFFCILWFTWCITSLYDIRFVTDSLLARIAKGVHLGVMVGLAVSGPKFDTTKVTPQLRIIALILMVSRFVLGLQYLLVLFHVREYQKTKLPLGLIGGTNFVTGFLYMGISFSFKTSAHAYGAFYVIAGFEMVVNIGVSSQWKVVTFKGTHLIERMTLLTLYILGEGVIDVLKSVAKISQTQDAWTSANIGTLFGAITAIYLFYMLYFDTLNRHDFGSIRQQLWSFLHFPFHIALVLCLSGMAQFVIWQKIMEGFVSFSSQLLQVVKFYTSQTQPDDTTAEQYVLAIQDAANNTFQVYEPSDPGRINATMNDMLDNVRNLTSEYYSTPSNQTLNALYVGLSEVVSEVWNSIIDTYGFQPSDRGGGDVQQFASDKTVAALNTAQLIFDYFFIATGFTIIFIGVLGVVNVRSYTIWSWVRFVAHILFGLACCLLCLLATGDGSAALNLSATAWPLPIMAMIVLVVLAIHHISWENNEADEKTGEKQYHFLPRWRPNRNGST
ncbi:bacterial low temperature requirement A protein-domain-containing protein [Lipomyces doorenjongii]